MAASIRAGRMTSWIGSFARCTFHHLNRRYWRGMVIHSRYERCLIIMPRCKRGRGGEEVSGYGRFCERRTAGWDEVKRLIRCVPERPAMTEVLRVLNDIFTSRMLT